MSILNFYRTEYKRLKLPKVKNISDDKLKEELKLIREKKSVLPSMARLAIINMAEKRGISL